MAWRLPALKAEAKTVKAMKTPAAKAKGMKPDTKTMKATKTPAAKAKGMKLNTKTMNAMKTPVAKENMKARRLPAAKVDASQRTLIRLDALLRDPPHVLHALLRDPSTSAPERRAAITRACDTETASS